MGQSVTFVDVETPNHQNNSISAIGIINVDGDGVVTTKYFLVDPESHFDRFNIKLTKITPEMVAGQPNFKEVWSEIVQYFVDSLVVAHNAIFDLTVINACLQRYQIKSVPFFYLCTYQLSRSLKIPAKSYKLNDLSSYYGVQLDNHHALADTKACMEIFYHLLKEPNLAALEHYVKYFVPATKKANNCYLEELTELIVEIGFDNYLTKKEVNVLKTWYDKNKHQLEIAKIIDELNNVLLNGYLGHYQYLQLLQELKYISRIKAKNIQSLYELMALLQQLGINKTMSGQAVIKVNKWLKENEQFGGQYPFNLLLTKLESVLESNQIEPIVAEELWYDIKNFFKPALDQGNMVAVKDKVICLTGNFSFGQRQQLEKFIVLKQGIISNSVTKKVDYLVLGSKGSSGYKYGKYGAKTNKALMMQSQGHKIELISEARLMEVLKLSK